MASSQANSRNRNIHSSSPNSNLATTAPPQEVVESKQTQTQTLPEDEMAPLSVLPLSTILRSLGTTTISSSRLLLPPSLKIMDILANSHSPLLNPDKNLLLRPLIKNTFYAQFCAGERPTEVRTTIQGLKDIGFTGVILGYAKEVVLSKEEKASLKACEGPEAEACIRDEIIPWANGTMETVRLACPGDYVALK